MKKDYNKNISTKADKKFIDNNSVNCYNAIKKENGFMVKKTTVMTIGDFIYTGICFFTYPIFIKEILSNLSESQLAIVATISGGLIVLGGMLYHNFENITKFFYKRFLIVVIVVNILLLGVIAFLHISGFVYYLVYTVVFASSTVTIENILIRLKGKINNRPKYDRKKYIAINAGTLIGSVLAIFIKVPSIEFALFADCIAHTIWGVLYLYGYMKIEKTLDKKKGK